MRNRRRFRASIVLALTAGFAAFVASSVQAAGPPVILSVSPAAASNTGNATITFTGSNMGTVNAATLKRTGFASISASPVSASGQSTVYATFNLVGAAPGWWDATVRSPDGESVLYPGAVNIAALAPEISSITPASRGPGAQGQTLTIAGANFARGDSVSVSGLGVTVNSVSYVSPTALLVNIDVADVAPAGVRNVTVTHTDGQSFTCPSCFTVNAAPAAQAASPSSRGAGAQNQTISVTGQNFLDGATVSISGGGITVNSREFVSSTRIDLNVSIAQDATAGARTITVANPDGGAPRTCTGCFTVNAAPTPQAITPSTRGQGATNQNLTLTGAAFGTTPSVTFSGTGITVNSVTRNSSTQLTVNVDVSPTAMTGARSITVVNPDAGIGVCSGCFFVNVKPTVSAASPSARAQNTSNQEVSVTGTGFLTGATVSFGPGVTVTLANRDSSSQISTVISVASDATPGPRDITVTNPDGAVAAVCSGCFTVNARPTVSTTSPSSRGQGAQRQLVTIPGTNFLTGATVGFTPSADITIHSTTVDSPTSITVDISISSAAATGSRTVTVTNPDNGVNSCSCFTIAPAPTVTAPTSPASRGTGAQSQNVVIGGSNFGDTPSVSFSGSGVTVNSVTYTSSTSVTANIDIAPGATTGQRNIVMTNPDGGRTTCVGCFTISAGPSVTSASPSSRGRGQSNQDITISGSNFADGSVVSFSGGGITVNSTEFRVDAPGPRLVTNISIASDADVSARDIVVTNTDAGRGVCSGCFSVTYPAPTVATANPSARGQGSTNENVVLTGTEFSASPTVSFLPTSGLQTNGITVNSVTRDSETQVTVNITVAANATPGTRSIQVSNPGTASSTCSACFSVTAGPKPMTATPSTLGGGATSQDVTITGDAVDGFVNGSVVSVSGTGVTVNSTTFNAGGGGSGNTLTANITVASDAAPGARTITVRNPDGGTGTIASGMTITAGPSISTVSPAERAQGTTDQVLTLAGSGFGVSPSVAFSGSGITIKTVVRDSSSQLRVTVDIASGAATGARSVTVTNTDAGRFVCSSCFTINARPTVSGLNPASRGQGAPNQTVTITGTNFAGTPTVAFTLAGGVSGITVHSVTRTSATQLVATISVSGTATPGARGLTVTNADAGSASCSSCFDVGAGPSFAASTPISPTAAPNTAPTTITINGSNLVDGVAVALQRSGYADLTPTGAVQFVSSSQVRATFNFAGAAPGAWSVRVTNPDAGSAVCSSCFTVAGQQPVVSTVSPSSRGQGAQTQDITITGSNFAMGAAVTFGGSGITVHSTTYVSQTQVVANVSVGSGATPGARNVVVTNADSQFGACLGCFTITEKPSVTTVSPNTRGRGAQDQAITITGAGFLGTPTVSFGSGITVDSVTRTSATQLDVVIDIASDAATGARTVSVGNPDAGTATCASCFSVNPGASVSTVSPSSRGQGATAQTVTVTGSNFIASPSVSFGDGVTVTSVTRNTAEQLTVVVSVASNATPGARNVSVSNADGAVPSVCASCFTVNAAPSATSVTPTSRGQGAQGQTITISGSAFAAGAQIAFSGSGISVSDVSVTDASTITAQISVASNATPGARSVTVTNTDGATPAVCSSCFTVASGPSISSVAPSSRGQGAVDEVVTLTGTGFAASPSVSFGPGVTVGAIELIDPQQLAVTVSVDPAAAPGARDISVTNADGGARVCDDCFTVNAAPTLTSVAPEQIGRNASARSVTLSGSGFLAGAQVAFGDGITVSSTSISANSITAVINVGTSATLGARSVSVQNTDGSPGSVCVDCLTVTAAPSLASITPATRGQGAQHQTVTIEGADLAGTPTVAFSGAGITVHSVERTDQTLTLDVSVAPTAATGARDVVVTNPDFGVGVCDDCFSVTARPGIASVSPAALARGSESETVTITGSSFGASPAVSFGDGVTVESVIRDSATQLRAIVSVAAGAASGGRTLSVTNADAGVGSCPGCFAVDGPPSVTLTAPSSVNGPATATFNRDVTNVSPSNLVMRVAGSSRNVAASVACRSASGASVSCSATNVRSAMVTPTKALIPGQSYSVLVNPAGVTARITDPGAAPVALTTTSFRAATQQQQWSPAASYAWRTVRSTSALGGSYTTASDAGSYIKYTFRATGITWYTMTGPDQGYATVTVDGVRKADVNNYSSTRRYKVARSVSGLPYGTHTIVIAVKGTRGSSRATGAAVSVDGFRFGTTTVSTPAATYGWRTVSSSLASGGTMAAGSLAGMRSTFTFAGTGVDLYSLMGPDQGKAAIYVDGKYRMTIDNYRSSAAVVRRSVTGLTNGVHTLRIDVLGTRASASRGTWVTLDRFVVR